MQLLAGAKINDVTPQKATALHLAATHDRATICTALLGERIHYDAVDDALNNGNYINSLSNVLCLPSFCFLLFVAVSYCCLHEIINLVS